MTCDDTADGIDIERRSVLAATAGTVTAGAFGLGSTGTVGASEHDGDAETVTIIHDTHFHGRFQDSGVATKDLVAYDALVDQWRSEYDNTLFLGNGDDLAPSVLGLEFEGAHMVEALNEMGIDAVGAGNHEFDFGVETASQRFNESEFPWLVANLLTDEGEPIPGTERWTTMDVGGVTVGMFGLVVNRFYSITSYPEEYEVIDNVEAAQEATTALREAGADIVVCPAHVSSGKMEEIAESVDDLDAIIGSHSGQTDEEPSVVNGTLISEFGDEFDHAARLEIDAESGDLVEFERADFYDPAETEESDLSDNENHTPVDVTSVEESEGLRSLVDGYQSDLEERLGESVVEAEIELNASFDNYAIETGWGNLMTDIMRDIGDFDGGVDVATQNAGGIRSGSTYGPGEISKRDIINILPFPNEIEVYELEGQYLYEYLENQVRPMPGDFGAQPAIQVSGVSYEWWGHNDETEIDNVLVGGEPIQTDETYLVSTNDYEAGRTVISEQGELVLQSGQFQGAFVMDHLESEYDTIAPEREHRMIRVDEWVDSLDVSHEDGQLHVSAEVPEASEGVVAEPFRMVVPSGEALSATNVEAGEDGITATFDAAEVDGFVDDAAPDPQVRLLGGFDPDEEYYSYESDGEVVELPVSSGYDHYKLQSEPDAATMLEALAQDSDDDGSGSDDDGSSDDGSGDDGSGDDGSGDDGSGDDGSGDDGSGDDGSGDDGSGDDSSGDDGSGDDGGDDGADDSGPGFGPLAALAGTGGAAYLLSERMGDEEMDEEE